MINRFKLIRKTRGNIFHVVVELNKGFKKSKKLEKIIRDLIIKHLPDMNADYKESLENNPDLVPVIELELFGKGRFNGVDKKIKYKYVEDK